MKSYIFLVATLVCLSVADQIDVENELSSLFHDAFNSRSEEHIDLFKKFIRAHIKVEVLRTIGDYYLEKIEELKQKSDAKLGKFQKVIEHLTGLNFPEKSTVEYDFMDCEIRYFSAIRGLMIFIDDFGFPQEWKEENDIDAREMAAEVCSEKHPVQDPGHDRKILEKLMAINVTTNYNQLFECNHLKKLLKKEKNRSAVLKKSLKECHNGYFPHPSVHQFN